MSIVKLNRPSKLSHLEVRSLKSKFNITTTTTGLVQKGVVLKAVGGTPEVRGGGDGGWLCVKSGGVKDCGDCYR